MNEDFVSFDLAKKLKEKGYTLDTAHHYDDNGGIVVSLVEFDERCVYPCPEIHQVLRWLREEQGLFVDVSVNNYTGFDFYFTIYEKGEECWIVCEFNEEWYDTYNGAAHAGIECCLDNWI